MDYPKIFLGLAKIFVVLTVISIVYTKLKKDKESKIKFISYTLGAITFVLLGLSIGFGNYLNSKKNQAEYIAKISNEQLNTPKDMGNGFIMEPIQGYDKTLKFIFRFKSENNEDIKAVSYQLNKTNERDMKITVCNNKDAAVYLSKGINIVYQYINFNGDEIRQIVVSPSDCKGK